MRSVRLLPFALALLLASAALAGDFDDHFTGRTLRFDYVHAGTASEEHIALDALRLEGDWPGSRSQLLDYTGMGKYRFELVEVASQRTLYSRGFSSIYGEWETIGEARRGNWRSFHESQRFPEPKRTCQLVLKKRKDDGSFGEIFAQVFDPKSRFVDRSPLDAPGKVWSVLENGAPAKKVDLLVLGDGYSAKEADKYHADVERLVGALFDSEPFRSRKKDFNVWAIDIASPRSGLANPRADQWFHTPLGLRFNAFDSERYVLSYENRAIREFAALAPYDAIMMVGNSRKYGGGGIFNLYATVAADTAPSAYVFVHELGHSFAGLADEYYTSSVSYEDFTPAGTEPWEPNITALLDPENLKWKQFLETGTPVPTPWDQESYDEASYAYQTKRNKLRAANAPDEEVEKLFAEVKAVTQPMLEAEEYFGKVGAFEGGGYQAKGLYRPSADCIMFTRNPKSFCTVCSAAIERVIDLYAK
jgi:hypothetical protein